MADDIDTLPAEEFAVLCAGYTGKLGDLDGSQKDALIAEGTPNAIASLAHICAHLNGITFDQMVDDARKIFEAHHDPEYSWLWRIMLASGGNSLDKRGELIEVWCDDTDGRDSLTGDLDDEGIGYTVEEDPEEPDAFFVLIKRGFLSKETRAA